MGTVGLSFGSPTSGAGFDVSTTVASIVGNLQNVETPWKTQLTALEAQDTTISSLGTLFSNLSNDLSSLTDFQGVMAQKEGSSSDTNVLALTAANSSATAGTHTIEVSNLAKTSSGYLAPLSSSSAKLTGSLTLQVGTSGTPATITLNSSDNTLAGLASAINASGVGVTASVLTDSSGSRLSLVSGTSGANGNIVVSSNSIAQVLGYSGTAGTSSATSTGTLVSIAGASDTLAGSLSIQVGSGTAENVVIGAAPSSPAANTIYTGSGVNTLAGLANAITTAGIGVTASVVTNTDGTSSLQLVSGSSGTAGSLTVSSSVADTTTSSLGYTSSVTGKDANLTVDGVSLTSASNTVANLIPGITFQLLAPSATESDGSLEQVQVVIANNNTGVESAVSSTVSDYNALVSALNTQEGNDSSGKPEPLFGSPTLSLLQQQLLNGLNLQNPNGYLDAISSTNGTTLAGQSRITIQMGSGASATFVVGSGSDSAVPGTYYTDNTDAFGVNNGNTISGLAATINAVARPTLGYAGTAGSSTATSSGALTGIVNENDTLTGSISIQVGSGQAKTITLDSSDNTLSGLMSAINNADMGVTASVVQDSSTGVYSLSLESGTAGIGGTLTVASNIVDMNTVGVVAGVATSSGNSTLTLASDTEGANGAMTVSTALTAVTPAALSYTDTGAYSSTTPDSGSFGAVKSSGDTLTGSMTIQVGSGPARTISLDSSDNTLSGLMTAINSANLGVQAALNTDGTALTLTSETNGSAGALTVTSNIFDSSNTTSTAIKYNNSSDINSLTTLGISVNNDGTLTLDATSLDSVLNSDYSSVVGFFQNSNSWGQHFSTMLTNAGTSSSTGILSLASKSNSGIESTLNADVSREESLISAEQKSLTAELTSANEIMQELPSQLQGVNELYSAITGYNENSNG